MQAFPDTEGGSSPSSRLRRSGRRQQATAPAVSTPPGSLPPSNKRATTRSTTTSSAPSSTKTKRNGSPRGWSKKSPSPDPDSAAASGHASDPAPHAVLSARTLQAILDNEIEVDFDSMAVDLKALIAENNLTEETLAAAFEDHRVTEIDIASYSPATRFVLEERLKVKVYWMDLESDLDAVRAEGERIALEYKLYTSEHGKLQPVRTSMTELARRYGEKSLTWTARSMADSVLYPVIDYVQRSEHERMSVEQAAASEAKRPVDSLEYSGFSTELRVAAAAGPLRASFSATPEDHKGFIITGAAGYAVMKDTVHSDLLLHYQDVKRNSYVFQEAASTCPILQILETKVGRRLAGPEVNCHAALQVVCDMQSAKKDSSVACMTDGRSFTIIYGSRLPNGEGFSLHASAQLIFERHPALVLGLLAHIIRSQVKVAGPPEGLFSLTARERPCFLK